MEGRHRGRTGALVSVLVHPMVSVKTVARLIRLFRSSVAISVAFVGFKACLSRPHRWDTVSTITVFPEVAITRETPRRGLELEGPRQPQGKSHKYRGKPVWKQMPNYSASTIIAKNKAATLNQNRRIALKAPESECAKIVKNGGKSCCTPFREAGPASWLL